MLMASTLTFMTEALRFVACVQPFKRNFNVKMIAYTVIAYSISTMRFNSKAMPIMITTTVAI